MIENNQLPQHLIRKPSKDRPDDYDSKRYTSKGSPRDLDDISQKRYGTYMLKTTTESVQFDSSKKYTPRDDSPSNYPMKSTLTFKFSPGKPSFLYDKSPGKSYPGYVSVRSIYSNKSTWLFLLACLLIILL